MLIHLYSGYTTPEKDGKKQTKLGLDGRIVANGDLHGQHRAAERQVRDVQEFELEALMSEDEDGSPSSSKLNRRRSED